MKTLTGRTTTQYTEQASVVLISWAIATGIGISILILPVVYVYLLVR